MPLTTKKLPIAFALSILIIIFFESFLMPTINGRNLLYHNWIVEGYRQEHLGDEYQEDKELGWRSKPYAVVNVAGGKEHLNSYGYRGPDITSVYGKHNIRIACLGDSTTFGVHLNKDSDTYPRQLESLLRKHFDHKTCEVFNLGVNGYGTYHGAVLVNKLVPALGANVAIAYYGWNDRTRIVGWYDHREDINSKWNQSPLIRWLLHITDPWIQEMRYSRKLRSLFGKQLLKHGQSLKEVEENLIAFVSNSRNNNVIPILATTPWGWKDEDLKKYLIADETARQRMTPSIYYSVYNIHEYNKVVRRVAKRTGVKLVDLESIFEVIPDAERQTYFHADSMHPNTKGNKMIVETLAPTIEKILVSYKKLK